MGEIKIGSIWGHDYLPEFWTASLSPIDKQDILSVDLRDMQVQSALNNFNGPWSESDVRYVASLFGNALVNTEGVIKREHLTTDQKSFRRNVTILQVFERKLVEYYRSRGVWTQYLACVIWKLFTHASSYMHAVLYVMSLLLFAFASNIPLLNRLRQWTIKCIFTMFDSRVVSSDQSALLVIGPLVLLASEPQLSRAPIVMIGITVSLILSSHWVSNGDATRVLYRFGIVWGISLNLFIAVHALLHASYFHTACILVLFNWSVITGLVSLVLAGIVLLISSIEDIIRAIRRTRVLRIMALGILGLSVRGSQATESTFVFWLLLTLSAIGVLVVVPSPGASLRNRLASVLSNAAEGFGICLIGFQYIVATLLIFQGSLSLGIVWVKYVFFRGVERPKLYEVN